MTHDQDDDDALAEIDLHVWHVPPPAALDRSSLLVRALSPAAAPAKRPRLAWILAAIVLLNAALVTLIVIVLAREPATQTTMVVQPAGGSSVDTQVRELLQRLEREQRELERKLAEIQELRALVVELSERVRQYEQQDGRRDRTLPPKPPVRTEPTVRAPVDPYDPTRPPVADGRCDEVSCILKDEGACCAKYRKKPLPPPIATSLLPEFLDRDLITQGVASVKQRVVACARRHKEKGVVKIRVVVGPDGNVTSVTVRSTPDEALGNCVARAVQPAVFARTQVGGSFSYPFVF